MPGPKVLSQVSDRLRITEIFYSLQGESITVGKPTVFIRLTGCPLRCHYCDTAYAFSGGRWWNLAEIEQAITKYNTEYVLVTGGEPLAQKPCLTLLNRLCNLNFRVSLETSGALDAGGVDPRVTKVLDIKTPASGESAKNQYRNIDGLNPHDQIKFVICDREDYNWAKSKLDEFHLSRRCEVLFSPSYLQLDARRLAEWILEDQLPVRLQIQLHKYLWGDVPGR